MATHSTFLSGAVYSLAEAEARHPLRLPVWDQLVAEFGDPRLPGWRLPVKKRTPKRRLKAVTPDGAAT